MRTIAFTAVSALLLLVALVFLVLATVSTPVATTFQLAKTALYTYGIFGYCKGSSCLSALYPVSVGDVDTSTSWLLSSTTRNTLAKAFIVAPIAAGLTLFALIPTVVSIFLDTSTLKIFSLAFAVVSFIATTIVAIFVVIVFSPNVAWTGWLLVAAAACCLVALGTLFLSIGVRKSDDTESDDDVSESGQKLGAYGQLDNDTAVGTFAGGAATQPKYQFYGPGNNYTTTDDTSSLSKDYSYRGTVKPGGYTINKNPSQSSLLDSQPKTVNDITRPNTNRTNASGGSSGSYYEDAAVNINNGPSTPVSSKQKMAPNYVPNVAVAASAAQPSNLPYPKSERGSTAYNPANYGVFDHHPDVEGHQPFTELGDNDLPERSSMRELDSDEDSDFTSVSQRPPNVLYQNQGYSQGYRQQPQQVPAPPPHGYQQLYPNVSQYQPQFQQQAQTPPQGSYYGAPSPTNAPPSGYQAAPPQNAYRPQYQQQPSSQYASRPANRGPTISDSILNNNPDFAIGYSGRKKQFGAAAAPPPANRFGAPARPGAQGLRQQPRDGPYHMS